MVLHLTRGSLLLGPFTQMSLRTVGKVYFSLECFLHNLPPGDKVNKVKTSQDKENRGKVTTLQKVGLTCGRTLSNNVSG